MNTYLAFNYQLEPDNMETDFGIKRVDYPDEELQSLFYNIYIYTIDECDPEILLSFIKGQLFFDSAICEIFVWDKSYVADKSEVFNISDDEDGFLALHPGKYIVIGRFIEGKRQLVNKKLSVNGQDVYVMLLSGKEKAFHLYLCCEFDVEKKEEAVWQPPITERQRMAMGLEDRQQRLLPGIPVTASINGKEVRLGSASYKYYNQNIGNGEGLFLYEYFNQIRCICDELKGKPLVFIDCYDENITEEETLPAKSLSLSFGEKKLNQLQQMSFKVSTESGSRKITYIDKDDGREKHFFINGITLMDLYKNIKDEQGNRHMEEICPRDKYMALLSYENPFLDIQLNFYAEEFLDRPLNREFRNSATMLFIGNDGEKGPNGFRLQYAPLVAVEPEFAGSMDVELFSVIKTIEPEKPVIIYDLGDCSQVT